MLYRLITYLAQNANLCFSYGCETRLPRYLSLMQSREKGRDLTQSCDKNPTSTEQSTKQRDNIKNATKNFDYTTIANRLRTVK